MEQFNPMVIRALMELRGIHVDSLCKLAHVSRSDMYAWLSDSDETPSVPVETQHEIARMLGVQGENLRGDVVHYWQIHEPLFSRRETTYANLGLILGAFGRAEVAFLARESDRALQFGAKSCFALRFTGFCAILEVTAHPLRTISFDPDSVPLLSWVPEAFGVLLSETAYDSLEPGAMPVVALQKRLAAAADQPKWERLRNHAEELDIPAEAMLSALEKLVPATHRVEHVQPVEQAEVVEQEPEAVVVPPTVAVVPPTLSVVAPPAATPAAPGAAVANKAGVERLFSRTQPVGGRRLHAA